MSALKHGGQNAHAAEQKKGNESPSRFPHLRLVPDTSQSDREWAAAIAGELAVTVGGQDELRRLTHAGKATVSRWCDEDAETNAGGISLRRMHGLPPVGLRVVAASLLARAQRLESEASPELPDALSRHAIAEGHLHEAIASAGDVQHATMDLVETALAVATSQMAACPRCHAMSFVASGQVRCDGCGYVGGGM